MHPTTAGTDRASASLIACDIYEPLPIRAEVSDAPLTSDAGRLPLRQFDHRIGPSKQFATALHDPRDPDRIDHPFPEVARSRKVFHLMVFRRVTASGGHPTLARHFYSTRLTRKATAISGAESLTTGGPD